MLLPQPQLGLKEERRRLLRTDSHWLFIMKGPGKPISSLEQQRK